MIPEGTKPGPFESALNTPETLAAEAHSRREALMVANALSGKVLSPSALRELRHRALNGDQEALEIVQAMWFSEHEIAEGVDRDGHSYAHVVDLLHALPRPSSSRPVKQLMYDSEYLEHAGGTVNLFQNYYSFCNNQAPRAKQHGVDTNMFGHSGLLPSGHRAHLYRIGCMLDGGIDPDDAQVIWNHGSVSLHFGPSIYNSWPMRALLPPPKAIPTSEVGICEVVYPLDHGADLTVNGKPLELEALEYFKVQVLTPRLKLGSNPVRLMVIFYTIMERALAG